MESLLTTADRVAKTPKYLALARDLRGQIQRGELMPGDRLPTFVEMRARFGVTPTTIERIYVLLEQEGLILRERGRGTFVTYPGPRPASGVIGVCGVSSTQMTHPYLMLLEDGFRQRARQAGVDLMIIGDESEIRRDKVDGVVVYETRPGLAERLLSRLPMGLPCVAALKPIRGKASVVADEFGAAQDLVAHLVGLGHRRIACLLDPLSPQRLAGYQEGLRSAGIAPQAGWARHLEYQTGQPVWSYSEVGCASMTLWLGSDWRGASCTALIAQNDDAAIGAIHALRAAGLRVPEDVSVAGFDGTEVGRYFVPSLTTVEIPLRQIGATAVDLLLRQIAGEAIQVATTVLPAPLLLGESTRTPRIATA